MMLNNQSPDSSALGPGLNFQIGGNKPVRAKQTLQPSMSKKKSIQSARKNSNKSPLDMHDLTNITKPDQDPDFTKFMNQSSS